MEAAIDEIRQAVGVDWQKMTPIVQRIKKRTPFGTYGKAVRGMYDAARAGVVEIKEERQGNHGPFARYVRIAQ